MEQLQELLFELSSKERMDLMLRLRDENLKLSELSKKQGLTNPETLRQLRRLCDVGLVQRKSNGLYEITPYGGLLLSQLKGVEFLAKNRDFFSRYDTSFIPYEYRNRFGELLSGTVRNEPLKVLEETQMRLKEAEEFVWIVSNQNFALYKSTMDEKLKSDFDFRLILPKEAYPSEDEALIPSDTPGMHKNVLPEIHIRLVVTDKYAGFGIPLRENKIDYRGIMGSDPVFYKWCKDLFIYYWEKSSPHVPYFMKR
jgi:predicted transcriptional regulator